MATARYSIWIEAEEWAPSEWTPKDDNSQVVVTLGDGTRWGATFVSYANVGTLAERHRQTGECLSGRYLTVSDLILVDEVTRPRIEAVVDDLLVTGDFEAAFSPRH